MIDFIGSNWDKILAVVVTVIAASFTIYRRFIKVEEDVAKTKLELKAHVDSDSALRHKIDELIDAMRETNSSVAVHEALIRETREDVREIRHDVKEFIGHSNGVRPGIRREGGE